MPSEALPLKDVVPKPVPNGLSLRERQPEVPNNDPDQIQVELRSEETLAPAVQETGTTTRSQTMRWQVNIMYASMAIRENLIR